MSEKKLTTRQIMNRIYKDIEGFDIPKTDAKTIRKSKGSPVYGEINLQSLHKLLSYLDLNPKDVFYDLGSGVGKVVIQTALTTPIKKAVGIELSKTRHQDAQVAVERAITFNAKLKKQIELLNKDFLTIDLSKASVIYTCSTAFSQLFMNKLCRHLATFEHPFRLISLQELPEENTFELKETLKLDMSWLRATPVHIYQRR